MMGSLSIIVAQHMYSMPPYPYLATDYGTQLSLFTHHFWIGVKMVLFLELLILNNNNYLQITHKD